MGQQPESATLIPRLNTPKWEKDSLWTDPSNRGR